LTAGIFIAALSLAAWIYLLAFRGLFWLFRERDEGSESLARLRAPDGFPSPRAARSAGNDSGWPGVVAVVPARNEADCIERSLRSLEAQDYPGAFRIVVVDDQSTDETVERIREITSARITVVSGGTRPAGWTGKLWALSQGMEAAEGCAPEYFWLADADIEHSRDSLSQLVQHAEAQDLVLVSLMAKLSCESPAERFLIPAFVFFFAMLFPFSWVNDERRKTAAGAGGCMLVRSSALVSSGGIEAIKGEIIDDCALARRLKSQGPIWLGLTRRAVSIRPYSQFGDIRSMVARSAFAQLDYSWTVLVVTIIGMAVVYGGPPVFAVFGIGAARIMGALAWVCMVAAFWPISRFYGRAPFWGLALPAIAGCYGAFTLDSAVQHMLGRGGMWKGRAQGMSARENANGEGKSLSSGKGHRDENFPVASLLIAPRHRGIILAFYRFVREADDIADHAEAAPEQKLELLEQMRRTVAGENAAVGSGVKLRELLAARGLPPVHALDLLEAFRRDVTKLRYRDWDDLVDYCSVSAMPVGRFVLDVHGESRATWPLNDALCAALQIINHLQDCGADYAALNRIYIPLDAFAAAGLTPEALSQRPASPQLREVFRDIAARTQVLLDRAAPFADAIRDRRLSLEVAVIHRLATDLNRRLLTRDPLSEPVHHRRAEAALLGLSTVMRQLLSLRMQKRPITAAGQ
jgi:squalene synthase HpnC